MINLNSHYTSSREDRPRLPQGGLGGVVLDDMFDQQYVETFRMRRDNINSLIDEIEPHYKSAPGIDYKLSNMLLSLA